MKETSKQFLNLLFNPDEQISVSPDGFAYHSIPQSTLDTDKITLISNNEKVKPKHITENDILLVSINPVNGPKNDDNVTSLRSFLVELDEGNLNEQLKYIEDSGLPYSVCVFSGNKSLHFGIVLEEPITHINVWRHFNQWILNILTKADQQVKNPSRSIRFPGNMRKDGKKLMQSIVNIKSRVKSSELNVWLSKHMDKEPIVKSKLNHGLNYKHLYDMSKVPEWIKEYAENGVSSERNVTWFNIACWFAQFNNIDEEIFMNIWGDIFIEERDFKKREWETAIKSAFKTVREGK